MNPSQAVNTVGPCNNIVHNNIILHTVQGFQRSIFDHILKSQKTPHSSPVTIVSILKTMHVIMGAIRHNGNEIKQKQTKNVKQKPFPILHAILYKHTQVSSSNNSTEPNPNNTW